jgi:hypothetical protein
MRLSDSVSQHIIAEYKTQKVIEELEIRKQFKGNATELAIALYNLEKRYFGIFDKYLDQSNEPYLLKIPEITTIIAESIDFFEKEEKQIINHSYCIMSNHLHWVFTLNENAPVLLTFFTKSGKDIIS